MCADVFDLSETNAVIGANMDHRSRLQLEG